MGYQQSLRPCEAGLALNVDSACTAFLEESPVLDFMVKAAGAFNVEQLGHCQEHQMRKISKALIGIKVSTMSPPPLQPTPTPLLALSRKDLPFFPCTIIVWGGRGGGSFRDTDRVLSSTQR